MNESVRTDERPPTSGAADVEGEGACAANWEV